MSKLQEQVQGFVSLARRSVERQLEYFAELPENNPEEFREMVAMSLPDVDVRFTQLMDWVNVNPPSAYSRLQEFFPDVPIAVLLRERHDDAWSTGQRVRGHLQDIRDKQVAALVEGYQKDKKVSERVSTYIEKHIEENVGHLRKIAQIRFNAWHYIDCNLWASMISKIFNELNHFVGNLPKEEQKMVELYKGLATTGADKGNRSGHVRS